MNGNFPGNWGQQLVPNPRVRTFVRLFTLVSPGFSKVTGYLLQQHPSAVLPNSLFLNSPVGFS
jgi:hypothetical protein